MARTTPVHSGYTIIQGTTTGSSAYKADTWVEYTIASQSVQNNQTRIIAYFYTALASGQTSGTYDNQDGGECQYFKVNGVSGTIYWNDGPYDYRSSTPMLIAKFDGYITHNEDGSKTITIAGSYSTKSSYISGGNISANVTLPTIDRGIFRVKVSGSWRTGIVYVKINGDWKQGQVFCKKGGVWKRGI